MLKNIASLFEKFPSQETMALKGQSVLISHPLLVSPAHFITPLLLSESLQSSYFAIFIATSEHFQHYQSVMRKVAGGLNLYQKVEAKELLYIDLFSSGSCNLQDQLPLAASFPSTFTNTLPNNLVHIQPSQPHLLFNTIAAACKEQKKQVVIVTDGVLEVLHTGGGVEWKGVLAFVNQVEKLGACTFWTWNQGVLCGDDEDEDSELGWRCCFDIIKKRANFLLSFKQNLSGFSLDVDGALEVQIHEDVILEKLGGHEKENRREMKYKVGGHGMELFYTASV